MLRDFPVCAADCLDMRLYATWQERRLETTPTMLTPQYFFRAADGVTVACSKVAHREPVATCGEGREALARTIPSISSPPPSADHTLEALVQRSLSLSADAHPNADAGIKDGRTLLGGGV